MPRRALRSRHEDQGENRFERLALEDDAALQSFLVFFTDEARFGQQGTLTKVWAKQGSRPVAVKQTRYGWVYLYAAVEPSTGQSVVSRQDRARRAWAYARSGMSSEFTTPILACLGATAGVYALAAGWSRIANKRTGAPRCPRCLYNVGALAGRTTCPECGTDLKRTGVIAKGTRLTRTIPVSVHAVALLGVFGAAWLLINFALQRLNILQTEERTYQVNLVSSDRRLNIGAGWWSIKHPFREAVEIVQFQPFELGGRLTQWYERGAPSRWRSAPTVEGQGEVPAETIWTLLRASPADRDDPVMQSRVADLRAVLLGGRSLRPPDGSDWRAVRPLGPLTDYNSSTLVVVATGLLTAGLWALVVGWWWRRSMQRMATAAPTVPVSS